MTILSVCAAATMAAVTLAADRAPADPAGAAPSAAVVQAEQYLFVGIRCEIDPIARAGAPSGGVNVESGSFLHSLIRQSCAVNVGSSDAQDRRTSSCTLERSHAEDADPGTTEKVTLCDTTYYCDRLSSVRETLASDPPAAGADLVAFGFWPSGHPAGGLTSDAWPMSMCVDYLERD